MLQRRGTSRKIAAVSVFAVIYSLTRLIPIAPYVGISSVLTFGETISPLSGMLFGPLVGGASVILGTLLDFALGRPVIFDGLDFLPGLASAVTAGLAFSKRRGAVFILPVSLMIIFSLDPLSVLAVRVGAAGIPYLWMHLLSVFVMASVSLALARRWHSTASWAYIAATVFIATMTAHVMGGIVYENILVRVNGVLLPTALKSNWNVIFFAYPLERTFFTVVGTAIALPVLRALGRRQAT